MQIPYSNLRMTHQNPGASKPLILPIHVICNTSDDEIYANIRANSRRPGIWQQLIEEHNGVAILCGSGPSLVDSLDDIAGRQREGAKVFAMNGAAQYLADNGVMPDYQVIVDARAETADLVGPAREHLFASQVHPACFTKAPTARVWHLQIGDIEDHFPECANDYCLIGGAASVGNTATCLAYAMGYRDLQIYGYDSSHRETGACTPECAAKHIPGYEVIHATKNISHAFHQKMNDGEPCASVVFNGKDYICSLTMKLQAEKFQETSYALIQAGCKIAVHGTGLLPDMFNAPKEVLAEHEKYERMWQFPDYRVMAPGEEVAQLFVDTCGVRAGDVVIDFGCGTGRGAKKVRELSGCEFILLDFTENSLDADIAQEHWYTRYKHDLTQPVGLRSEYGFCTDVMEHIPPADVDTVIRNVMAASCKVFFQISLIDDNCGALIGHPLHLSVHSFDWWKSKFGELGYSIGFELDQGIAAIFYVVPK